MDGATDERALLTERVTCVLRRPVRLGAYRVLGRGVSGATTYRLTVDGTDAVLKLTAATSATYVLDRAHREILFYRTLAAVVPLRVPCVLGVHQDAEGVALLLAADEPAPPPKEWQDARYITLAQQLARFHAMFWDKVGALDAYPWVLRPRGENLVAEIEGAHGHWRALRHRPQLAGVFDLRRDHWLHSVVADMGTAESLVAALPPTLCHGDCNPGNVLVAADGGLVWADWQEVRTAQGPEDLSFLLQQAAILGGDVPYDAALTAYRDALTDATGRDIPLASIRCAVAAAELRSRALHWPAYLGEAAPDEVAAMLWRIRRLANELGLAF